MAGGVGDRDLTRVGVEGLGGAVRELRGHRAVGVELGRRTVRGGEGAVGRVERRRADGAVRVGGGDLAGVRVEGLARAVRELRGERAVVVERGRRAVRVGDGGARVELGDRGGAVRVRGGDQAGRGVDGLGRTVRERRGEAAVAVELGLAPGRGVQRGRAVLGGVVVRQERIEAAAVQEGVGELGRVVAVVVQQVVVAEVVEAVADVVQAVAEVVVQVVEAVVQPVTDVVEAVVEVVVQVRAEVVDAVAEVVQVVVETVVEVVEVVAQVVEVVVQVVVEVVEVVAEVVEVVVEVVQVLVELVVVVLRLLLGDLVLLLLEDLGERLVVLVRDLLVEGVLDVGPGVLHGAERVDGRLLELGVRVVGPALDGGVGDLLPGGVLGEVAVLGHRLLEVGVGRVGGVGAAAVLAVRGVLRRQHVVDVVVDDPLTDVVEDLLHVVVRVVLAVRRPIGPRGLERGDRVLQGRLRGGQGVAQLRLGDVAAEGGVGRRVVAAAQLRDIAVVVGLQLVQQMPEEAGRLALPGGLVLAERGHPLVHDVRVVLEELHHPVEGLPGVLEGEHVDGVVVDDRQPAVGEALRRVRRRQQVVEDQLAAGDVLRHRARVPLDMRVRALERAAAGDLAAAPQRGPAVLVDRDADHHDAGLLHLHAVVRAVPAGVVEGQVVVLALVDLPAADRRVVGRGHRPHVDALDVHPEQLEVAEVVVARTAQLVEQGGPGRERVAGEVGDGLCEVVVRVVVGGPGGGAFGHGAELPCWECGGGDRVRNGRGAARGGVSRARAGLRWSWSRCRSCRRRRCRRCPAASRRRSSRGCRPGSSAGW